MLLSFSGDDFFNILSILKPNLPNHYLLCGRRAGGDGTETSAEERDPGGK